MTARKPPKSWKVWVLPESFAYSWKAFGHGTVWKSQSLYKADHVRATLTLDTPPKRKPRRKPYV